MTDIIEQLKQYSDKVQDNSPAVIPERVWSVIKGLGHDHKARVETFEIDEKAVPAHVQLLIVNYGHLFSTYNIPLSVFLHDNPFRAIKYWLAINKRDELEDNLNEAKQLMMRYNRELDDINSLIVALKD